MNTASNSSGGESELWDLVPMILLTGFNTAFAPCGKFWSSW